MITKEQLAADKALCEKATAGPLALVGIGDDLKIVHKGHFSIATITSWDQRIENGQALVNGFNRLPEYIAELEAMRAQPQSPAELVQRLQETEDALLEVMGFRPVGKRGFYLDTQGDERTSPGVDWPRSAALDFARERVTRGAK